MATWKLTVRKGSRVERERFDRLDDAIAELRRRAVGIAGEDPLPTVKAFRDYGPERRVAARLELSRGGWLRGREAGLDVMGDGRLVAYEGAIRKRELDGGPAAFDAIREALT